MIAFIVSLGKWIRGAYKQYLGRACAPNILRVGPAAAFIIFLSAVNWTVTGVELGKSGIDALTKANLAYAINRIPSQRRAMLRRAFSQGKISGYRMQLELQLLQDVSKETTDLAQRILRLSKQEFGRVLAEKGFQGLVGLAAAGAGPLAAGLGKWGLSSKEIWDLYNVSNQVVSSYYSGHSVGSALSGKGQGLEPDLNAKQRILALKLLRLLETGLKKRQHELMAAKFRLVILGLKKSYCNDPEKDYQEYLRSQAQHYAAKWNLTQNAGSRDSIWRDWRDLQAWLHERVLALAAGRCKRDEEPKRRPLTEADCPRDLMSVRLVFHKAETSRIADRTTPADHLRCVYYKWFKGTGKQLRTFLIGDCRVNLVRLNTREAAVGKFPWAMDVIRRRIKEAFAGSGSSFKEQKPSRDVLIITAAAQNKGVTFYVKYAAIRYKNSLLLIHTHISRDEQWISDVLTMLQKKFRKLIDEKG